MLTYNLKDVIKNIKRLMDGSPPLEMMPYSRGFMVILFSENIFLSTSMHSPNCSTILTLVLLLCQGSITKAKGKKNSYTIAGNLVLDDDMITLNIYEIPYTMSYDVYEEHLNNLIKMRIIEV